MFFFQAEDGIRDHCVTGVQTCALPISYAPVLKMLVGGRISLEAACTAATRLSDNAAANIEIGRASCRERV